MSQIILTDGDGFDEVVTDDVSYVVLYITRREVEAARVGDIVDRLMNLSDRADYTQRFKHSLVLMFDGYDDDPRELTDIPEVTSLFRAVDAQWPFWLHFLSYEADSLQLATKMLLDLGSHQADDGRVMHTFDQSQLSQVIVSMIKAMNLLHQQHALSVQESKSISDKALEALNASFI